MKLEDFTPGDKVRIVPETTAFDLPVWTIREKGVVLSIGTKRVKVELDGGAVYAVHPKDLRHQSVMEPENLRAEREEKVRRDVERRDLTMSRLEGEITRELKRSGLTVLEALLVLQYASKQLAEEGVTEERADETEIAPVKVDWLANPLKGSSVPPERLITPDPVPELDSEAVYVAERAEPVQAVNPYPNATAMGWQTPEWLQEQRRLRELEDLRRLSVYHPPTT